MRRSHRILVVVATVTAFVGLSGLVFAAGAQTDAELGSYAITATAPGFEVTEDQPSAQAHPEGQGAAPQTSTLLANGGVGYGLAAIAWPGATAANGGALLGLLVPSQVGGQPTPDAVSGAVRGAAPAANYPVKAEARTGSAPDASYTGMPGVVMTAHADPARVAAEGSMQRVEQPGTATYGNVRSTSESTLTGVLGRGVATSTAKDIDLGGVVKIKSVTSTATAQTDGTKASGTGGTVVQGMTIAEQNAYVDDQGVHIGEQGQPANAVASQIANQALTQGGFQFYVSQPFVTQDGATATSNAGSLFVVWKPPDNPSNNVFTFTFGGARVSVTATLGSPSDLVLAAGDEDFTPASGPLGEALPSVDVPIGEAAPQPSVSPGPAPSVAPDVVPTGFRLARTFGGLGWAWLVAALAAVALSAAASRRMLTDLLDRPATTCPLERDQ